MMTSPKILLMTTSLALAGMVSVAAAHPGKDADERLCNTVIDGGGNPVRTSDGGVLRSSATFVCPTEEVVVDEVVVVEEEPVAIEIDGNVMFDFDQAVIKPEFQAELDEIAAILQDADESLFSVIGHTDSTGSEAYNQGLSERRAQAVTDYLIGTELEPALFIVEGKGETQPIASNDTREGRARNRRVEIRSISE